MNNLIYLDYAAATPVDQEVLAAAKPFFTEAYYNPSALYKSSKEVSAALEAARSKVAHYLGVRSPEIIFTAGGTEANNLAISGIMNNFPDANIVISAIEHDSVIEPAAKYDCRQVKVNNQGLIDVDSLRASIDDQTVLVSVMYANNEIGTIQPLAKIGSIIDEVKRARRAAGNNLPLYFHSDACQAANYLDLKVHKKQLDLMTLNGGKIYGFKQTGALFVTSGIDLNPLIVGGGQERNRRSGTENVAGAIGFAAALSKAQDMRLQETERLSKIQKTFIAMLEERIPGAVINGSLEKRLPNNVNITIAGQDNERLIMALDEAGIMAAAGSACSASSEDPSHVLKAIGLADDQAQASLRFTMGRGTTIDQIKLVIDQLEKLI